MKKVIFTESQVRYIVENLSEYTKEQIDEFVIEAENELRNVINSYNTYKSYVINLTIKKIQPELENHRKFSRKMKNFENTIEEKYNKYYDIVDAHEFLNYPENVKKLEKINYKIYDVQYNFYEVREAHESLIDAASKIKDRTDEK